MKKLKVFLNMKRAKLCFISLLILSSSSSFGQGWLWGEQGYGDLKANDYASPVATDKNGNAYITGQYESTIIFGNDTLKDYLNDNAYLTKYNSAGNVIWTTQMIDSESSYGTSVATDLYGSIYVAGMFYGNANVGPFRLNGTLGGINSFLVKYNSNGNVIWAKQSTVPVNSATSYAESFSVATDKLGNIFIAGYFSDTVSFGAFTLKSIYYNDDAFLVKYDSSGNVLWAKQAGIASKYSFGFGYSVTADKSGNAYITGYFYDTLTFGATSLFGFPSQYSGFLAKYSPSGNLLWAKQSINNSSASSCYPTAVITDCTGNPYITGYFADTVQFGSQQLHSTSPYYSAFFTKYDTNGNAIWAKPSSPGWEGSGLASDKFAHIYMSGVSLTNVDTLEFGSYILHPSLSSNIVSYLMKFDTSGNPICGSIINSLGKWWLNGVASDSTGTYIYTASVFLDTVLCGPDTLFAKGGGENTFVCRWGGCLDGEGLTSITPQTNNVLLYPNPNNGQFTIAVKSHELRANSNIEVYNMLGEKVYSNYQISNGAALMSSLNNVQLTNTSSNYQINLSSQPNGIYLYRVISETGQLIGDGKLIIQK